VVCLVSESHGASQISCELRAGDGVYERKPDRTSLWCVLCCLLTCEMSNPNPHFTCCIHPLHHCVVFCRLHLRFTSRQLSELKVKVKEAVFIQHFIMSCSSLRRSDVARVNKGSHSFTCRAHVYPQVEWAVSASIPPLQITERVANCKVWGILSPNQPSWELASICSSDVASC